MERPNILENGNIKSVHLWQGQIICFWEEKFLSLEQKKNEQGRLQLWIYLRKWQPTPVFLPGKSHEWRSPVGYSPGGRKELDTIERLHFTSLHFTSQVGRRASQVVLVVKSPPANAGDISGEGVQSLVGKIPWRRAGQPISVFLPGESHGQRSLAGCSPRGCKESDTTERLNNNRPAFLSNH